MRADTIHRVEMSRKSNFYEAWSALRDDTLMRSGNATLVVTPPALIASANGVEDAWQMRARGLAYHSASLKGSEKREPQGPVP
ncbi:uncharacterized [Tachysurus ichikawai]